MIPAMVIPFFIGTEVGFRDAKAQILMIFREYELQKRGIDP